MCNCALSATTAFLNVVQEAQTLTHACSSTSRVDNILSNTGTILSDSFLVPTRSKRILQTASSVSASLFFLSPWMVFLVQERCARPVRPTPIDVVDEVRGAAGEEGKELRVAIVVVYRQLPTRKSRPPTRVHLTQTLPFCSRVTTMTLTYRPTSPTTGTRTPLSLDTPRCRTQ